MKFISRNINLRVVLRPGIQGEPMIGRSPTPGLYVKFEDGVAEVNDPESIKMLMTPEKGFGSDFVAADDEEAKRFIRMNTSEPEHDMINIEYGHVGRNQNPKAQFTLPPEMKAYIETLAAERAAAIAKPLALELVKEMLAANVAANAVTSKQPTVFPTAPRKTTKIEVPEPIEDTSDIETEIAESQEAGVDMSVANLDGLKEDESLEVDEELAALPKVVKTTTPKVKGAKKA